MSGPGVIAILRDGSRVELDPSVGETPAEVAAAIAEREWVATVNGALRVSAIAELRAGNEGAET